MLNLLKYTKYNLLNHQKQYLSSFIYQYTSFSSIINNKQFINYNNNIKINQFSTNKKKNERIKIKWKIKDDSIVETSAPIGKSLLEAAHDYADGKIDLEGACEASIACSTCHVILEEDIFDELEFATEEEDDLLDAAFGLTETSRLGCQVILTKDMDGMLVTLPKATRNFYVDGHIPEPH